MYEYAMWTQAVRVSWDDGTARSHAEELNKATHRWMPELQRQFDEVSGGGWEAISHDNLRTEDGLLMTVLARRPSTQGSHPTS